MTFQVAVTFEPASDAAAARRGDGEAGAVFDHGHGHVRGVDPAAVGAVVARGEAEFQARFVIGKVSPCGAATLSKMPATRFAIFGKVRVGV